MIRRAYLAHQIINQNCRHDIPTHLNSYVEFSVSRHRYVHRFTHAYQLMTELSLTTLDVSNHI